MIIPEKINKFAKIAFLPLVLIHIIILENLRFTLWPEMVVYPYLVNNGFALYKDLINPYPPTLTLVLSFLTKLFGYSPLVFQAITWFLIAVMDLTLYFITLKITRSIFLSLASLCFFLLISVPFGVNGLWFDLVQTPIILLSVYYFYRFFLRGNSKYLNIAFGLAMLAFFIKQQALWLIFAYIALLAINKPSKLVKIFRNLLPSLIIFISTAAFFLLYLLTTDNLSEFFNWVFVFPFFKASNMPGYISLPAPKQILPIILVYSLCLPGNFITKKNRSLFIISLVLVLFAYPRFDFFHLIPALAVSSILFGQKLRTLSKASSYIKLTFLLLVFLLATYTARYILKNNTTEIRFFEAEITGAASFLELTTDKKDPIYVQNGPDQILPLASRLPVKPWADEFPWYLENTTLQSTIVSSMISDNPKFIVFKPYNKGAKYDLGVYRPIEIADYLDRKYADYAQISKNIWIKKKL